MNREKPGKGQNKMKKLVIALLVLVMLTACIGPAMAVQYYSSKFTAGTDGWYALIADMKRQ